MDGDIQAEIKAGHYREALELLLARYQRKVFRLAYSILGEEAAAEEMAQDIFVKIWKVLPAYRGEASLSTWIYAITRNSCLTRRRQMRRHLTSSLDEAEVKAAVEHGGQAAPERARTLDCAALLAELPPPYRRALALFYLENKSYDEVSAMLDLPAGTVKTYLHRARKQLAASLAQAGRAGK
ncbi:MAG TPA: RNA polymerase sigma factor [Bryobacteraceae bacterium]|nr:RNA polymerase sigma factor [Bryobacteraceae bacterium]